MRTPVFSSNRRLRPGLALLAGVEKQLHAQADAEEGFAGGGELLEGVVEAQLGQPVHPVVERADSGQQHAVAPGDLIGGRDDARLCADALEHVEDRPGVAQAVADDRDAHQRPLLTTRATHRRTRLLIGQSHLSYG
jgi:hypothetical protein